MTEVTKITEKRIMSHRGSHCSHFKWTVLLLAQVNGEVMVKNLSESHQKRVPMTNNSVLVRKKEQNTEKTKKHPDQLQPAPNEYFKEEQAEFLTGSLPSMASSHSLLLDSDSACSVITPCLERFKRKAGLSLISFPRGPWTDRVYIGSDHYKRTSVTKIAHVQMLDFKLCPEFTLCFTFPSQLKATSS